MVQVILIRPGSTDYDQQGRIQGTLAVPLNDEGHAEVGRLIEELRGRGIDTVYAAPHQAAQQTAEALANALDVRMKRLDRMQNLNHGLWQGMLVEEIRQRQPTVYRCWQEHPESLCPPGGEMLSEVEERVSATLARLLKRHPDGVVALVLPEPLASLARRWLNSEPLGDLWKALGEHGSWQVVDVEPAIAPGR